MTDTDHTLVARFLAEHTIPQPRSAAFTRRVMAALPRRERRMTLILQAVCAVAGAAFFIASDGVGQTVSAVATLVQGVSQTLHAAAAALATIHADWAAVVPVLAALALLTTLSTADLLARDS